MKRVSDLSIGNSIAKAMEKKHILISIEIHLWGFDLSETIMQFFILILEAAGAIRGRF